jgi:hypothetical protein
MGNKNLHGKQDYGEMHLELSKQEFTSGEVIQGKVHLQVYKKFPGKNVCLEISGKEKSKWQTIDGHGSKKHRCKHLGENSILVSKSVI